MGKAIGVGLTIIWVLIIFCSFFFAILIKKTNMTEDSLSLTLLIVSISIMFIGGLTTGLKAKQKGWLLGATTGILVILILFLIQFLGLNAGFQKGQILYYGGFFLACVFGAIIGVNFSSKQKRA